MARPVGARLGGAFFIEHSPVCAKKCFDNCNRVLIRITARSDPGPLASRSPFLQVDRPLASTSDPQTRADKLAVRKSAEQDVLMREVDEAVRRDQLEGAARQYGLIVGGALLALLLALGAWLFWRDRQEAERETRSEQLVTAFDELESGALPQADEQLAPLATGKDDAAAIAASLARAGIALRDNRRPEAMQIFQAVADNEAAPQPFRDLAAVRLSAAQFEDVEPTVIIERLRPLAVPGNPWFGSAGELVAMAYLKQGRADLAGPLLAAIAQDENVPQTLRSRTRQLAGLLGVDAVGDVDETLAAMRTGGGSAAAPQ